MLRAIRLRRGGLREDDVHDIRSTKISAPSKKGLGPIVMETLVNKDLGRITADAQPGPRPRRFAPAAGNGLPSRAASHICADVHRPQQRTLQHGAAIAIRRDGTRPRRDHAMLPPRGIRRCQAPSPPAIDKHGGSPRVFCKLAPKASPGPTFVYKRLSAEAKLTP